MILEDGPFEWGSALLFLAAAFFFMMSFLRSKSKSKYWPQRRAWLYILLALFFFVAFGEEISWGQRIFGLETPDFLKEHNVQEEINIHNLEWIFGQSGLASLFSSKRIFIYACLTFLLVIPLLDKTEKFHHLISNFRIPVGPLFFGILFISNAVLMKILRYTWFNSDKFQIHSLTEIMETNFALIIFALALYLFMNKIEHSPGGSRAEQHLIREIS